jgi:uroporphyrinogen III methyltransferase/synthase
MNTHSPRRDFGAGAGGQELGKVWLVGAGPGDPGLFTLKGKAILEAADVVVYDRLVSEEILFDVPPRALLVPVGKSSGSHPVAQEEIHRILCEQARAGKNVVRLKGGDPFLFGRGGEEMLFLAEAGIPCEAVPGVSSALAVPEDAGIPLTHRDYSSLAHIFSWRVKGGGGPARETLEALAHSGGTLVILMGGASVGDIGRRLEEAGFNPDTPAALIENGASALRRVHILSLAELARRRQSAASPALVVVGEVCRLAANFAPPLSPEERLPKASPADKPLAGLRIVVTRPQPENAELCREIRALGGVAIPFACIRIVPLAGSPSGPTAAEIRAAENFSWLVFTSAAGADAFFEAYLSSGGDFRRFAACRFAAIGPATAQALKKRGFVPDCTPESSSGRDFGEALAQKISPGETVLLVRALTAAPGLAEALMEKGLLFQELPVYETVPAETGEYVRRLVAEGGFDYALFASPSAVSAFRGVFPEADLRALKAVCMGESTAARARELGMDARLAAEATIQGMLRALRADG